MIKVSRDAEALRSGALRYEDCCRCSIINTTVNAMIRPQTCAVCDKELKPGSASQEFFPFCSERCRNVDLYRWTEGRYAIVEPLDEEHFPVDDQSIDHD